LPFLINHLNKIFTYLIDIFSKLEQTVIWKWETETMEDKPENLYLSKWLPQQDILGHPNVKLFIYHGGQSSFQEALCHKKPTVLYLINFLKCLKLKTNDHFFILRYINNYCICP